MRIEAIIGRMEAYPAALDALLSDTPSEDTRWKPPSGAWSILEIVAHLADEEVGDFRTRVRMTLEDPTLAWPPIDPEGWAVERGYNDRELRVELERFAEERRESVRWLRSLESSDWSQTYHHPKGWDLAAGDVMVSWAAHDALHLRQIAKRLFELAKRDGTSWSPDYAGDW